MSNAATTTVTIRRLITSRAFRMGVNDYLIGLPFRNFWGADVNMQWSYERGRQLAALLPELGVMIGKRDKYTLQRIGSLFSTAYKQKDIL